MPTTILDTISSPQDLKKLSIAELRILAEDIRAEIIASTSRNGGHIAPSLGAVELILACHKLMDCPKDKLIFDVGHQAYAHKIITGRADKLYSLRQLDGLSGFPKRKESEYDTHDSGHASDSLATALGIALARDLEKEEFKIVSIVGDAAMSGGMAFEALNQIGTLKKSMVIILNDNSMSISPSVGAFASYLAALRTSLKYQGTKNAAESFLQKGLGEVGSTLLGVGKQAKEGVKQLLVPGMFFEELGISYLGPVDGHNLHALIDMLERAFKLEGPVLIHAITKKGKGFAPAEDNSEKFHGISPFESRTGELAKKSGGPISYTKAFSDQLIEEAAHNPHIVAITAAMPSGTGLDAFERNYPERFLDVGIAEECAVTCASGLAIAGKRPVVAIYSTFLQRAYDQVAINVCEQNLPVVFAIDRAGLVGEDGPTHHGAFDMSYLRALPNLSIVSPSDEAQLKDALYTALRMDGPVALRYPRGAATGCAIPGRRSFLEPGKACLYKDFNSKLTKVKRIAFLSIGRMLDLAKQSALELEKSGDIDCMIYDMLWLKPLDQEALADAASRADLIVSLEEGAKMGGFSSALAESMADQGLSCPLLRIGLDDTFVEQGAMAELLERVGLSSSAVVSKVQEKIKILSDSQC